MANLLRWSAGMALPKKKEENNVFQTSTPLISSLKTMSPTINNRISSVSRPSNSFSSTNNALNNSLMRTQQINERIRQQAEQRRQQELQRQRQEEQQRQQRLAEQQRQQEQRKQQEQAKKLAQQRQQEQKQRNLLNSAGLGNFGLNTDIRSNIETQRKLRQQAQERAAAKKQAEEAKNPWKKYYDEEKQKVRDSVFKGKGIFTDEWYSGTLQDMFNPGWDSRLAETNAKNRYASELLNQGQTEKAKKAANEAVNTARQNSAIEHAKGKALGATDDSEIKDNPFLATFNAIRSADIGNAMLGGADNDVANALKFLINSGKSAIPLYGWASGIMRGLPSVAEALAGRGLDYETGDYKDLNLLERGGRALTGGIDMAGPKLNASEKLASTIMNLARGGAKNVATQGGKAALMGILKNALGEGIEEGVQEIGDYFGEGNTLTDENGNISGEKIGEMAGRAGQAAGLGALGGGLMSGANIAIGKAANAINTRRNANVDTNVDTNIDTNIAEAEVVNNDVKVNEETNIDPARVQTTQDGTMVKTNTDGTTTRLSDNELANVVEQSSYQPAKALGTNPFIDNSVKLTSGTEDVNTLLERANNGDESAKQKLAEILQQSLQENQNSDWRGKSVEEVINPEDNEQRAKEAQFKTLQETNPMRDDYHTGIRSANEINTLNELVGKYDPDSMFTYPDFTIDDAKRAASNGEIEVFSSKPIEPGAFITPSRMMAQDYAGSGEVYSKVIPIEDFAAIRSGDEGNYLPRGVDIKTPSELDESPEILDSERAVNDDSEELANAISELYGPMPEDTQVAPSYDEDLSMQKIADVLDGKTSFDDYIGDQRELLWKSFKDSQRGTETFYHRDENGNIDGRHTVSDNGTLYRQLYQEYGGRPTKAEFNEALDDVLINGKASKYYDGFREFDHDGERSIFGFNQGNENIDMILDLKDDLGAVVRTAKQQKLDAQMPKNEVKSIDQLVKGADTSTGNKFVTILRGVNNKLRDVVKNAIGVDISGYNHVVTESGLNHALNKHGDNGSLSVTMEDIKKIPDIIKNADNIEYAGKNKQGLDVIRYAKAYDNRVIYMEEIRNGRHQLAMDTMYKQDIPAQQKSRLSGESSAINATDSLRALSRSGEIGNSNISQTAENVNQSTDVLPEDFDVKHYVTDQAEAQKKRSKVPLRERIADATAELKHYLVDDAVAYERYIKDKNERLNIREGVDRVRSSDMIARQYMQDHGLGEVVKMSDADLNEFQQYLIAKRALEVAEQGKATGRSKAADQALIESVGNKYAKEEAIIRQYTRDMLEYSADNGLISEKLKDKLIEENPNYVPMNRVFDVVEKKTGFKSKQLGNLNNQSVVQKMTGSERVVDNPIESLMTNTMRMINEVERNKTAKLISQSEAFHEKTLKDGETPRPGYDKLSYMIDGETVSYEVPELVAKEMKNLNNVLPKAAENILKVAGAPTRWLRSGATQNNPIFAVSNLLRDQMQTVVTGKVSANLKGTKDALIATFSPTEKGKALRNELNRAGIIGSEYRQTYGYKSGDLMAQLQADNKLSESVKNKLKHPVDAIGDLIGRTEYFTRAQQYFGTDGDATTKAQAARNNTLNFNRAGSATRILNRIIPFLNAGVQGGRITVNSFKNRPIHTTLAMASLAGVALAAKGAAEAQDKELWDRIDDSDKGQNIIIFTPDAHYNSETNRVEGIIKIPVAQMLYPIMDATNNLKGDASDATMLAGDIFTAVTGLESPNEEKGLLPVVNQLTPTAFKPFIEAAMNKNTYTGNEIVSEYDSNKAPEDKGAKYTTGLARTIAKATGIDAPVVDNFIQNWGGGLAKDLSKVMTDNPDNKSDGGGIGKMFENGFNRRFLSGTVESQYEIAEGLAKNYKNEVKNTEAFKSLSSDQQQKVLNAIDSDMKGIASISAKVEQGKANEDNSLTKRQTEIVANGFDADNYINAIIDKKAVYSGSGQKDAGKTLTGNVLDYGKTAVRNNAIDANDSISNDSKSILNKYNSMTSDDWNKYLYGTSAEAAAAEYNLALAKYENDTANGDLNEAQKIKREKELAKLYVSQKWTKNYRDAYSLAGTKADMQAYLNTLDDSTRAETVSILNGLNNAMYEAGIIQASTYKTRYNAINNTTSSSSSRKSSKSSTTSDSEENKGISSAEASAIASLAKTMSKADDNVKVKTPEAPTTKRKMSRTKSSGNSTGLKTYTPSLAKNVTVTKGANRSIV